MNSDMCYILSHPGAGECKRQKEPLICPLCRKVWVSDKSPSRSTRTVSPNVPCPLEHGEITLPHSDPIPREQVELARPWVEVSWYRLRGEMGQEIKLKDTVGGK